MEIKNDELIKILSHFPKIDYAIAYGSSVIPQIGYNIEKNKVNIKKIKISYYFYIEFCY